MPSFGATNSQITRLLQQKKQKMAQLEQCAQKVKGFKIAGISTLGLTAVGVGGNIALASKNKSMERDIDATRTKLDEEQEKLEKKNAEISAEKLKIAEKNCNKDTHVWDGKECNPKPKEPTDNNNTQPITNTTVTKNAEQTAGQSIGKTPDNSSIQSDDKNNNTQKSPTVITSDNNSTNAKITTKPQTEVRDDILLSPDDLQAKADADYKQYRKDQAKPNSPAAHIPALKNTMDVLSEANQDKSISMQLAVPTYGIPNNITVTQSQLEQVAKQAKENEIKQKELEEKKAKEEKEREKQAKADAKQAKKDERQQKRNEKNNKTEPASDDESTIVKPSVETKDGLYSINDLEALANADYQQYKEDQRQQEIANQAKPNSPAAHIPALANVTNTLQNQQHINTPLVVPKNGIQLSNIKVTENKLKDTIKQAKENEKQVIHENIEKEKQAIAETRQEIEKDNPDNFM